MVTVMTDYSGLIIVTFTTHATLSTATLDAVKNKKLYNFGHLK